MFLFPESREFRRTCNRCGHLSWPPVLSLAACTRSGFRDRNTCTACTNEVQSRTWDKDPSAESTAAPCHIARSAKPYVSRAYSPALAPCCNRAAPAASELVFLQTPSAAFHCDRGPDIHAAGI